MSTAEPVAEGPRRLIQDGDSSYLLLGTAHVSRASAEEVRRLIRSGSFDAVAIELCASRKQALLDPKSMEQMDLIRVVREGKAGLVAASLALGAFQQRLAEQSGIEAGAEMRAAVEEAKTAGLPLLLIDRDVGVTLRRVYHSVPWWQRFGLISGLLASVVSREAVSEQDIERLKQGDILESTFAEFAQQSRALYRPLIEERDQYMALRLRELNAVPGAARRILVVIGAGHLKGMTEQLQQPAPGDLRQQRQQLETLPPGRRWFRSVPWLIVALVLLGFAVGFSRNAELGVQLISEWFLINGTLSALGAAIALGHPVTILAAFFAAPFTSLNPTIGAGMVAAFVEISMRRPTVGDFSRLKHDVASGRGWWRNRVSRTLLVFLLSTLGSALGTYIAGFRIFEQLMGS